MSRSTRQSLLDAAYDLFSTHGFHAIGLDRILSVVGVTKTTFYNHFESKDDLILALMRHRDELEIKAIQEMMRKRGGRSARGQLYALFDVIHELLSGDEFRACIFINAAAEFPSPHEPAHQAAAAHMRAIREMLHDLALNAGAADPQNLADQLSVLLEGSIVLRVAASNKNAALIAREAAELVLNRALPEPAGHAHSVPSLNPIPRIARRATSA